MIPYINWTAIQVGPITIYVWGLFVALGFILAAYMAGRFLKKQGGEPKVIYDLTFWMLITGIVGGRLGYVFFYAPLDFLKAPFDVLKVWDGGLSLYGGIILSVICGVLYLKKRGVNVWQHSNAAIYGLPFGLWIGRLGCFFIHDHPGTATDFVLGVEHPDGIIRHDHGLYLSINGFLMAMTFLWLSRKKRSKGFYVMIFAIWYGAVRFSLDFFRIADVNYLYLTPAQYFSIALLVFGIWMATKSLRKKYE